jgi:small subunit ribosomal protein S1
MDQPTVNPEDSPEIEQSSTADAVTDEAQTPTPAADQSPTPEAADAPSSEAPPENLEEAIAQGPDLPQFKRGEVIEGTVVSTSPTSVLVDVGGKSEGIIPGRELERMNRETIDLLKPGEKIPVYVVNPNDHNGNVILSVNRALEELDWKQAEVYRESQEVYESNVAGYNKGGLIVRFGRVRGFVPQSQISPDRRGAIEGETPEERWSKMVNEPISVKVMEVDRSRNRLILSERVADREVRESRKENLIGDLAVGEVRTGRVVSLVDFGAFVDIGGAEGLVHLTEMSWQHVTHPRELFKVGDEVKVEVISVDPSRKRIGLSIKRQAADPWDAVAINYNIGQLVQATITKITKFGAFAQLVDAPDIEGLIHISELSEQRVNRPQDVVNEGESLTLRVVKMDIENRRLGLSLKRVNSAEYMDMDLDWD